MNHPPFPSGANCPEIHAIQHLHHVADRHREPEVRSALSGRWSLIVELIEDRGKRRDMAEQWDRPHDGLRPTKRRPNPSLEWTRPTALAFLLSWPCPAGRLAVLCR